MTQKFPWLAALTLFLAVGANAVRAEDEQKEVAPTKAAPCCQECGSSCKCCGKCCKQTTEADLKQMVLTTKQYAVTTKFVNASPDGDCDETMLPKPTVFEGQIADVLVQGEQTPTERHSIGMHIRVTNQEKRVHLDMGVENKTEWKHTTDGQASAMTAACHMGGDVTLGKMKRFVLTKFADGSDASWVEVTVNLVAAPDDENDSAMDYVGEVVDDLIDTVADVANTLFGDDAEVEQAAFPTPTPLPTAPNAFPVQAAAQCPACQQCVAVEAAKKPVRRMHIHMADGHCCVECNDGQRSSKTTADRITVHNGSLELVGHVHFLSQDGDDELNAEKITMDLANVEIQIGD